MPELRRFSHAGLTPAAIGARRLSAALGLGLAVGWSIGDVGAVADRLSHAYGVRLGLIGLLTTSLFLVQTVTQIPAITTVDFASLTTTQLTGLTTTQIGALTTTQIGAFTSTQIGSLNSTQINALF